MALIMSEHDHWPIPVPHPMDAAAILARATVYRARVGQRPAFPSMAEAMDYERGYLAWPTELAVDDSPAARQGWSAAFCDDDHRQQLRDDDLRDRAAEARGGWGDEDA